MNPNRCLGCLRLVALAGLAASTGAPAADVVSVRTITPELATDIARAGLARVQERLDFVE